MSHWTDAKLCQLVTLYSQFNNLWDKNHPCYFNLQCRHESYDKIRKSLCMPGVTVTHVLSKLWDLRSDYVAELRKVQLAKKQNLPYRPKKKWFFKMHQFFYDCLDSDEKPSDASCASSVNSSLESSMAEDDQYPENQGHKFRLKDTQKRINTPCMEKENKNERRPKPSRFDGSGVEFKNHFSWRGDEANLLKYCEDKAKNLELEKGHFSKSRRRLFQESSFDEVQRNTDKFSTKGSKRGQCTSSSYVKNRDQEQEHRSNNLQMFKLLVPTSLESRRSTSKPEKEFSCCSNCTNCNETTEKTPFKNPENLEPPSSENVSTKFKSRTRDHQKGNHFDFEENALSSDSLIRNSDDDCEEVINDFRETRRVLRLEELSEHITQALNDMFIKLCPVNIAFNPDNTNKNKNEINHAGDPNNNSKIEETNGKENRESEDSSEDKTNSVEDDNFSQFGTEVARVLKQTNREKALRLKATIKQTLESAKEEG